MRGDVIGVLLVIAAILGLGIIATAIVAEWGLKTDDFHKVATIVQSVAAVSAVGLGALFAYRNSLLFRTFQPHITITHSVSHRLVGSEYIHLGVVATLYNSSRVKVEIQEGVFQLAQVSPIDDVQLLTMYRAAFPPDGTGDADEVPYIPWPLLDEVRCATETEALVIEPGETHLETAEFIISSQVKSVLLYSYFYNSQSTASNDAATVWTATTPYDIGSSPAR